MLTQQSFQQRPFETKIGKIETKESGFEALKQVETHQMALFYTNRCHTPYAIVLNLGTMGVELNSTPIVIASVTGYSFILDALSALNTNLNWYEPTLQKLFIRILKPNT